MAFYTAEAKSYAMALNQPPVRDIDPVVVLEWDGFFRAIDRNTYDVDCNEDGFFSTSPIGFGRTPLNAIVDLLDNMDERDNPYKGLHDPRGPYDPNVNPG